MRTLTPFDEGCRAYFDGYIEGLRYAMDAIKENRRHHIAEELEDAERIFAQDYGGDEE